MTGAFMSALQGRGTRGDYEDHRGDVSIRYDFDDGSAIVVKPHSGTGDAEWSYGVHRERVNALLAAWPMRWRTMEPSC